MKSFYHRGSFGDIIYGLYTVSCFGQSKLILKNDHHFNFLKDLLYLQPYIGKVGSLEQGDVWGEFDYNLDCFRKIQRKPMGKQKHLVSCHLEVCFPESFVPHTAWLENIDPNQVSPIVINRTPRYHDKEEIDWGILKKYEKQCVFIGKEKELRFFESIGIKIPFYKTETALDAAKVIKGSSLFIGNQSFCYALSEAMDHNRILEVCQEIPNCMPLSKKGAVSDFLEKKLSDLNIDN